MRELEVLIGSSLAFPPRHSPPLPPGRRHQPQRRRKKPSPATPWPPPNHHSTNPLLSDVRRDLTSPSSNACAETTRSLLKYYAALASKLAGSGRLEDFLMVAESVLASDAVAAGNSQFVARIDTELVSRGLSAVLRRGELGEVMEFLERVHMLGIRPSALFDRVAAEDLGDQCRRVWHRGEVEEFVALLETLAGYEFYIKHIVDPLDVLKILVKKGDANMAIRYASVLPHWQLLFCWIIQEFGKKKDLASALNAYEAVKRKLGGFNMFACRSIIDVCGLCGTYLRSRILFKELLTQEITPNTHVFNSLMNVNAHDLSYTFYVYRKMQNLGVTPDVASYNILLKACCLARRVDLAQDIYKEIKDMESSRTLELDVITYSTMIKAFADAKMWQMALKIKEDMLLAGVTPNIVTWSTLIGACANAGLVDQAIQVFEEMLLGGCEPNAQCCNILLHACVESCQYDRAFRFFCSWKETGFQIYSSGENRDSSNMQDSLPSSTGNEKTQRTGLSHDPAIKYARNVPFRPTTATYNILMKACGTDYRHAKELMNEMQLIGLSPNRISWSVLIDICGSSCNVNGALQAFKTMREVGIKPDVIAYTTAIKACIENKNLKIAYSLFEEMKKYQLEPNLVTYNTLLRARSRYGSLQDVRQCLTIYQDMRKAGYSANDRFLKELLEEWCEGVLCTNGGSTGLLGVGDYFRGTDKSNSQSGLIEKVAILLQKDMSENQVVDLRGLSKIEARIVVLSVLRMIKESYAHGDMMNDGMIIMTGLGKEIPGEVNHEQEVQQAISNLLQGELGLDIVVGQGGIPVKTDADMGLFRTHRKSSTVLQRDELPGSRACVRKPQDLGVLRALASWPATGVWRFRPRWSFGVPPLLSIGGWGAPRRRRFDPGCAGGVGQLSFGQGKLDGRKSQKGQAEAVPRGSVFCWPSKRRRESTSAGRRALWRSGDPLIGVSFVVPTAERFRPEAKVVRLLRGVEQSTKGASDSEERGGGGLVDFIGLCLGAGVGGASSGGNAPGPFHRHRFASPAEEGAGNTGGLFGGLGGGSWGSGGHFIMEMSGDLFNPIFSLVVTEVWWAKLFWVDFSTSGNDQDKACQAEATVGEKNQAPKEACGLAIVIAYWVFYCSFCVLPEPDPG